MHCFSFYLERSPDYVNMYAQIVHTHQLCVRIWVVMNTNDRDRRCDSQRCGLKLYVLFSQPVSIRLT